VLVYPFARGLVIVILPAMAQENVEAVRGVYERWARGDFAAGTDLLDPEAVLVIGSDFPDAPRPRARPRGGRRAGIA